MAVVFLSLLTIPVFAKVWTNVPDWAGKKRNLKIWVPPGSTQAFKDAVQASIDEWNQGNNNGDWTLSTTSNEGEADVDVTSADPGGGADGLTTLTGTNVGGSTTNHMSVKINPALSGTRLQTVIMHELGHCMRMDHTNGVSDLMHPSGGNNPTTPSDEDKKEAAASAKNKGRVYTAPSYTIRDESNQSVTLTTNDPAAPFTGLLGVSIAPLTGADVTYTVTGWGYGYIVASVNVASSAAHNEAFQLTLTYAGNVQVVTSGVLWVADTPLPNGSSPHAVAGNDIIVHEYQSIALDGTGSWHNSPSLSPVLGLSWTIQLPNSEFVTFLDGKAVFNLPVGQYTATLSVLDYYGQVSTDTLTIDVVQ